MRLVFTFADKWAYPDPVFRKDGGLPWGHLPEDLLRFEVATGGA